MAKWQIFSAVALRRLPELIPRRDPIEIKVQQIFHANENANSRYSRHEMQHLEDIRIKDDEESGVLVKETAQDLEDLWTKEMSSFRFAEHNESLSKTHYLFMKLKFGSDIKEQWLLPQAKFDRSLGDKSLLDTARRALKESLNIVNGFRILGKVPSSVYSFRYPKKIVEMTGHDGAKVFFMRANLELPSAAVLEAIDDSKIEKLKWLTRDDALGIVDGKYMNKFVHGLLHENRVNVHKVLERATMYAKTIQKLRATQ